MEFSHRPVMLGEVIEYMNVDRAGTYADGTLGGGGHAEAILSLLGPDGRYIGLDQDGDAVAAASARLAPFAGRFTPVRANYVEMPAVLESLGISGVNGILLDLGVSSYQIDNPERGFSYASDAPLDMRMDDRASVTAADIVNSYSERRLMTIFREYGEERFSTSIARGIIRAREKEYISTTGQLAQIVSDSVPAKYRYAAGHPAKRVFQAIRIEVNRELDVLENSLDAMIGLLYPGARICVITFHSLEDRIVKNAFKRNEDPCTCPPDFPVCVCGKVSRGKVITKKPVVPSEEEILANSRAKSAKLRVFERT